MASVCDSMAEATVRGGGIQSRAECNVGFCRISSASLPGSLGSLGSLDGAAAPISAAPRLGPTHDDTRIHTAGCCSTARCTTPTSKPTFQPHHPHLDWTLELRPDQREKRLSSQCPRTHRLCFSVTTNSTQGFRGAVPDRGREGSLQRKQC